MATAVLSGRAEARYGDSPQALVDEGTNPRGGSHTSDRSPRQIVGTDAATSGRGRGALAHGKARLARRSTPATRPGAEAALAFLSDPRNYPHRTMRVDVVETHMSRVFLTDRHAFKMKKPVRTRYVDLRTVRARQCNCIDEVRLNRRLAAGVYFGAVPLLSDSAGNLSFSHGDQAVEWLVMMRRLPAARMLDRLIVAGSAGRAEIAGVVARMCSYYRRCRPLAIAPSDYRARFADGIREMHADLSDSRYGLSPALVDDAFACQRTLLANQALFDERVYDGRIVEGHGDLRPEHVCLETVPQVIDCLDFSRTLRTLDTADELAFLALECERLGSASLSDIVLSEYCSQSGDTPPDALMCFYRSYRACVRAMLALRHLDDAAPLRDKWLSRARAYLALAARADNSVA